MLKKRGQCLLCFRKWREFHSLLRNGGKIFCLSNWRQNFVLKRENKNRKSKQRSRLSAPTTRTAVSAFFPERMRSIYHKIPKHQSIVFIGITPLNRPLKLSQPINSESFHTKKNDNNGTKLSHQHTLLENPLMCEPPRVGELIAARGGTTTFHFREPPWC